MENESLIPLTPAPEERLQAWLSEFYGSPVHIDKREILRHRDLSYVERICVSNALPESIIYKLVLPPWDIEQDLHERVLIPSICNSARLFLAGHYGQLTALFIEDLGEQSLLTMESDSEIAARVGKEMAKLHRAYSYRIDELMELNVLRSLVPIDYESFTVGLTDELKEWGLIAPEAARELHDLAALLASKLAGEPISLVHGDLFAENILVRNGQLFIIDWSWFTIIGVPTMDLASLISGHYKNGSFAQFRDTVLDAYCFEAGRSVEDVLAAIPHAESLSRLLFLNWLVERRRREIMGTTIGPVDQVIPKIVDELRERYQATRSI